VVKCVCAKSEAFQLENENNPYVILNHEKYHDNIKVKHSNLIFRYLRLPQNAAAQVRAVALVRSLFKFRF
jgi:hypothetical protein